MATNIPELLLARTSGWVSEQLGLHFPRERWIDLERGLNSAGPELGFKDVESTMHWILSSNPEKSQIEILAGHLTVGETYFFREKKTFQVLEEQVLPDLIHDRRQTEKRLRIWSAGCCTGEEPYSIAILLQKVLPDIRDWNITVLASDINPRALRKAAHGVYSEWSFRETPTWIKERYFAKRRDGRYQLDHSIRELVTFSYLNLVDDSYPSLLTNTNAMDVIFCRNVLMYFAPDKTQQVARKLSRSLIDDGWLVVSPSELSQALFSDFEPIRISDAILYRKSNGRRQAAVEQTLSWIDESAPETENNPAVTISSPPSTGNEIDLTARENPHGQAQEPAVLPERDDIYSRALGMFQRGQIGDAAQCIIVALQKNGNDSRLLALLACIHAGEGKLAEAEECCRKAMDIEKLNPAHRYLLATVLKEQGRSKESMSLLRQVVYLDETFVLANFLLGNLAHQQGSFGDARKHYKNTLNLLAGHQPEQIVAESEGLAAGRLKGIVESLMGGITG